MARIGPLRNFRFRLEIDNIAQAGFSDATIGETWGLGAPPQRASVHALKRA